MYFLSTEPSGHKNVLEDGSSGSTQRRGQDSRPIEERTEVIFVPENAASARTNSFSLKGNNEMKEQESPSVYPLTEIKNGLRISSQL